MVAREFSKLSKNANTEIAPELIDENEPKIVNMNKIILP